MTDGLSLANDVQAVSSLGVGSIIMNSPSVSGQVQADLKVYGIDTSGMTSEAEAKKAITDAKTTISAEATKSTNESADIQDTVQISQSYSNKSDILKKLGLN